MIILRRDIAENYFAGNAGAAGIKAATTSFRAWHTLTFAAEWTLPQDIQAAHPKASILRAGRVVFNIKGNDFRLVCRVNYVEQIVEIRWFGSHAQYDQIDAETI
jgi:mRNA interferase HigB